MISVLTPHNSNISSFAPDIKSVGFGVISCSVKSYTLEKGRQKAAGAVCAAFRRKGKRERKV
ncbi:MAG: hypothetical protein F6K17_29530 [Okeania sp. SIO3C4]|nr:hypothetical protein [Okeania sp. SIO3C4]